MKMIIAINNKVVAERIVEKYKTLYDIYIMHSKEEILDMIQNKEEFLIIVREDIQGNLEFIDFLDKIKLANNSNRVVLIIKELSKERKEALFSKEVFNIIEGNNFLFEELIENIENPKMVIYKNKKGVEKKTNIIMVTGSKGAGKTLVSKVLSEKIARNRNKKVLVMDLDFIYPCLDLYLDCDKNYSLVDIIKDINEEKVKKVDSYESNNKKYNNLKYILNMKPIGMPKEEVIINMIRYVKRFYDYVIIDSSSLLMNKMFNIAKILDAQVIFVMQMSLKGIREYNIDTMFLDKEQLSNSKLILNKYNNSKSLEKYIKTNISMSICGMVKKAFLLDKMIERKTNWVVQYNFRKLLKSIGIIKFEKIKLEIVKKILNIEEE